MKKDLLFGAPKSENILRGSFGLKRASVFSFLTFESRVSFTLGSGVINGNIQSVPICSNDIGCDVAWR